MMKTLGDYYTHLADHVRLRRYRAVDGCLVQCDRANLLSSVPTISSFTRRVLLSGASE